jgi:hypothetical protein
VRDVDPERPDLEGLTARCDVVLALPRDWSTEPPYDPRTLTVFYAEEVKALVAYALAMEARVATQVPALHQVADTMRENKDRVDRHLQAALAQRNSLAGVMTEIRDMKPDDKNYRPEYMQIMARESLAWANVVLAPTEVPGA